MRTFAVVLMGLFLAGCAAKLSKMAKEEARYALHCDAEDLHAAVTLSKPPFSLHTVKGCGKFVRYKGTCDSTKSGCDAANRHPECDGTCRLVEREEIGDLEGAGEAE